MHRQGEQGGERVEVNLFPNNYLSEQIQQNLLSVNKIRSTAAEFSIFFCLSVDLKNYFRWPNLHFELAKLNSLSPEKYYFQIYLKIGVN